MASPPPFPPPDGNGDGDVDGGGPGLAGASFSPITPSRSKRRIEACREAAGYRLPLPPPSSEAPSPPPSPEAAAAAAAEEVPAGAGPKSFPLLSRMGVPLGSDPTSAGCRARILGELVALGRGRGGGGGRPTHLHPYVSSNGRRGRLVRVPVRYRARPGGGEDGRHHHPALEAEERFLEASARTGFMPDLLAALGGLGEGGGKGNADEDAEEAGAEAGTATGTGTEARLRRRQRSEAEAAGAHLAARYLASEHPEAVSRVAGWAGEELAAEAFERDRRELVRADCGSPPPLPLVESRPSSRIDGGPAATVDPGADYDGTGRQGWNARYVQLTAYKQRYGNCLVPTSTELGRWVAAQRTARRRWLEEKAREEEEEKERTREDEGEDEAEGGEGRQQRRGRKRKRRRPDRLRDLLDRGEREGRHRGGGPGGPGGGGDDPDAFPPTVAERRFDLLDAVGGFVWNAARLGMGGRRRRPGGGGRAAAEAAAEERAGTGSASASAPGGDRRLTVALAARLAYPVLSVRECLELGGYGEEELEEVVNPKFAWRTREVLLRDKIYRTEKGWAAEEEEDAAAAASAGGGNGEGGSGEGGERRRGRKNTARRRQVRSLVGRLRDGSGGGTGVAEAEAEAFGDRAVLLPQYLAAGAARREAGVARDGPTRRRKRRPPRRRAAAAEAAQAAGPPPPSGPGACGGGGSDSDSVSVSDQGTVAEEEASAYASPAADGVVAEELMAAVEMAEAELGEDLFEADEDGSFLV